jgi:hypothetical protein
MMEYVPAARAFAVAELPPAGLQLYVYPGVPPAGEILAVPFELPQVADVVAGVNVIGGGSVNVTWVWAVHPLASVMVA